MSEFLNYKADALKKIRNAMLDGVQRGKDLIQEACDVKVKFLNNTIEGLEESLQQCGEVAEDPLKAIQKE